MDSIWVNLKSVGPPFFKFMSVYIEISLTQLKKSLSVVMTVAFDFANERLLLCQFDI